MTRTKKQPITLDELHNRQAEQERVLAALKSERSDAILEGKPFDAGKLRDAQDELSAIDEAITEFKRREEDRQIAEAKAEAAISDKERLDQSIADIRDMAFEREAAISEAEEAARSFADALYRAEHARQSLQGAVYGLIGKVPVGLMPGGQEDRLSKSFSAVLSTSLGKGRFGEMVLRKGMRDAEQPWLASEQPVSREIEAALEALKAEGAQQ